MILLIRLLYITICLGKGISRMICIIFPYWNMVTYLQSPVVEYSSEANCTFHNIYTRWGRQQQPSHFCCFSESVWGIGWNTGFPQFPYIFCSMFGAPEGLLLECIFQTNLYQFAIYAKYDNNKIYCAIKYLNAHIHTHTHLQL